MAAINTRNYSWSECEIRVGGRLLTGVQGVAWTTKQEKEYVYGKGNDPQAIKKGNKSVEGSLTVLQDELEQLLDQAPQGDLMALDNLDIQVAFLENDAMVRYSIIGVSFTEKQFEMKQNDKVSITQLPFMALREVRS